MGLKDILHKTQKQNIIPKKEELTTLEYREQLVNEIIELKEELENLNAFDPKIMNFSPNHVFSKDKFRSNEELEIILARLRRELRSVKEKNLDDFTL